MSEYQASRTLVKSPPELWAECSDARSLARHLGEDVGEIRIRRLEPETTIAWEGERISGTVRLEPSGWGTKVTLTAAAADVAAVETHEPVQVDTHEPVQLEEPKPIQVAQLEPPPSAMPEPTPPATPEPPAEQPPPQRNGFGARFRRLFASRGASAPAAEPIAVDPPAPEPVVAATPAPEPVVVAGPAPVDVPAPEPATAEASDDKPMAVEAQAPAEAPPPEPRADPVDLTAALDSLGKAHHRPFSRA